ncbi:Dimethylaniline monooxygenase [N-oxide-forming] 5 [Larimichthys crocea]|uniref:Flavin-containing monooxygenase n=1 Tax=Larimichthys crocea TaxID=215358 RepID=A0A6G0ITG4_LARCR|nr:Dimethylaniline monooxygenase [N-oxide-forming] 5 [Larimichthys crocea]
MTRRVAVIGGGSSGLACIKCCLDEGLEPVCYESSDDFGGLWRFKENPEPDRASIYHSVIINTSKEMMCFSDFPIPGHFPNFMHNSLIMDYFRMYADNFQLTKYIRFNTKVLQVKQRSDFSHSGQWDVETENKDGKKEKHIFDAVMICIGHHCHPNMPLHDFPGIDTFKGKYFHSRDYKTPEEWRNKKAVVIGIGNSGIDIAVELSRVTKQVTGFPFHSWPQVVTVTENKASLYKYVFPPELARPTLAIIGLVQPLGAIMPISEMQARWATRVFKGCIKLPSVASMLKDIQCKEETMAKRYVTSHRHTIQVDYVRYMDEIAKMVGVLPNFLRLLLTDPRVGLNVIFGPCTPYQYRLRGPGKWAGAREAILTQWERVAQPMQTRPCDEPQCKRSYAWLLMISAAVMGLAAYINRNSLPSFLQDPAALLDKIKAYWPAQ